ncbi:hypothetical protein DXT63_15650 [Thermoanaerobacteraceae bacterium SP2]|nr:hypothetical protein DXT63_15650 [Thermoanaerobacteraceae bacterium SP2]
MKKLIIIGAGGFSSEVIEWARHLNKFQNEWYVYGLLDDNKAGTNLDVPIIGKIENYIPNSDEVFICAIGDPKIKYNICIDFVKRGAQFINLIHPTAIIGESAIIGKGIILCPYSVIAAKANIGDFVTINLHSTVGHNAVVKSGCTISSHCDITGFVNLEECVFIGSHSSIIPSVKVGKGAKIGAGSIVIRNVRENVTVFGNPAHEI